MTVMMMLMMMVMMLMMMVMMMTVTMKMAVALGGGGGGSGGGEKRRRGARGSSPRAAGRAPITVLVHLPDHLLRVGLAALVPVTRPAGAFS